MRLSFIFIKGPLDDGRWCGLNGAGQRMKYPEGFDVWACTEDANCNDILHRKFGHPHYMEPTEDAYYRLQHWPTAAANVLVQMSTEPAAIKRLGSKQHQLTLEAKALERASDPRNQLQLAQVKDSLAKISEELNSLIALHNAYKEKMKQLNVLKEKLASANRGVEVMGLDAHLKGVEAQIKVLAEEVKQYRLCTDTVGPEQVLEVVSRNGVGERQFTRVQFFYSKVIPTSGFPYSIVPLAPLLLGRLLGYSKLPSNKKELDSFFPIPPIRLGPSTPILLSVITLYCLTLPHVVLFGCQQFWNNVVLHSTFLADSRTSLLVLIDVAGDCTLRDEISIIIGAETMATMCTNIAIHSELLIQCYHLGVEQLFTRDFQQYQPPKQVAIYERHPKLSTPANAGNYLPIHAISVNRRHSIELA
ncbi:hypothetical protein Pelo_13267 [Pelomyxa schiedti]|nr:hypothetical protein Pelo_13267 [Pelomyxa schiedti]